MLPIILRNRVDRRILLNLLPYSTASEVEDVHRGRQKKRNVRLYEKDHLPDKGTPDQFGTLSKQWKTNNTLSSLPDEEGDRIEVNYLEGKEGKTRLRTKQYADMIKQLVKEKRITDALDVLDKRMIQEDRAQPENYIYNLLIGACARVGYTKKAFQLYNQMKKRGLKVTGGTYTSLFNACANSPWSNDGLKRANHLRELMKEKAYVPNQSNYHAMIKAYGRCGDVPTAFSLVDEMVSNEVEISSDTINFLLQACVSDKEAGFRHALLVWRKLVQRNIPPTIYTYNLLLRCVRDCGIGNRETVNEEIAKITSGTSERQVELETKEKFIETGESLPVSTVDRPTELVVPNLLATIPHVGTVVRVGNITKAKHRMMLVGGCDGFLKQMSSTNVSPDIKTITQLLEILPSTLEAENALLEAAERYGVALDTDFCNMLIKKRNMRHQYSDAKDVLKLINSRRLKPDIMTFGVLSLSCRSSEETKQLIADIDEAGYRVNIEILGSLLRCATHTWDISMIFELMNMVKSEGLKANKHFLNHLKVFYDLVQHEISIQDKGGRPHKMIKDKYFMKSFKKFCGFYKDWKNEVPVDDEDSVHPWQQFFKPKDKQIENTENFKVKKI